MIMKITVTKIEVVLKIPLKCQRPGVYSEFAESYIMSLYNAHL